MIEDLHTAYWKTYGGGGNSGQNFFRFLSDIVDDMHHWYTMKGIKQTAISKCCSGIHIHGSVEEEPSLDVVFVTARGQRSPRGGDRC
jgi:hypothetical protein